MYRGINRDIQYCAYVRTAVVLFFNIIHFDLLEISGHQ